MLWLAVALLVVPETVHANDNSTAWITYYTETNGRGWPYPSVIACPYLYPNGTLVRILGLNVGSPDEFTGKNDLFVCQDRYATYLAFHFDVWLNINSPEFHNITGIYSYTILGKV